MALVAERLPWGMTRPLSTMANHHPLFNAITLDAPASQIVLYWAKVYSVDSAKNSVWEWGLSNVIY